MTEQKVSLLTETTRDTRRKFIQRSGGLALSATAVTLLAGTSTSLAGTKSQTAEKDITVLNTAISAEHEAVAAYQLGAESGLLEPSALKLATSFQGHHKEHVEALSKAVQQLGGAPVSAKDSYAFPVEKLKTQKDVLEFAAGLERGAVSAYAGAIPVFDNRDLSAAAASILADEAMHWAVLRSALGLDPVPGAFFS